MSFGVLFGFDEREQMDQSPHGRDGHARALCKVQFQRDIGIRQNLQNWKINRVDYTHQSPPILALFCSYSLLGTRHSVSSASPLFPRAEVGSSGGGRGLSRLGEVFSRGGGGLPAPGVLFSSDRKGLSGVGVAPSRAGSGLSTLGVAPSRLGKGPSRHGVASSGGAAFSPDTNFNSVFADEAFSAQGLATPLGIFLAI